MNFGVGTDSVKLRMNSRKKRVEEVGKMVYLQIAFQVLWQYHSHATCLALPRHMLFPSGNIWADKSRVVSLSQVSVTQRLYASPNHGQ